MSLVDEIFEKNIDELRDFIGEHHACDGVSLELLTRQELIDFIADHIFPEFQTILHSECRLEVGNPMFPNAENIEDIEEEMEHLIK